MLFPNGLLYYGLTREKTERLSQRYFSFIRKRFMEKLRLSLQRFTRYRYLLWAFII